MSRSIKFVLVAALSIGLGSVPAVAQRFSDGYTFLKSVKDRDGATVESLLAGPGARLVNIRDMSSGEGALHIVARERDLTWLRFLLSKGAKPDIQSKEGDTPLGLATRLGWADGVAALLAGGANVNYGNGSGETALIIAVQNRDLPMVRLLLAKGADPKRQDRIAGSSALDYAKQDARNAAILELLEEAKPPKPVSGPTR